jgi:hypothetical protein
MDIKYTYGSEYAGKWRACFEIARKYKDTVRRSELCSALLFDSENEADEAGKRAESVFLRTRKLPDLTELF